MIKFNLFQQISLHRHFVIVQQQDQTDTSRTTSHNIEEAEVYIYIYKGLYNIVNCIIYN